MVTFNNVAAVAVTLPQAASTFSTFNFYTKNVGAGTATITPQGGSTICGSATLALATNTIAWIISDGTNYNCVFFDNVAGPYLPLAGGTLTGRLFLPAGNLAAPSLSFTGATDVGIYNVGGGVGFASSGVINGYFQPDGLHLDGVANAVVTFPTTGALTFGGTKVLAFPSIDSTLNGSFVVGGSCTFDGASLVASYYSNIIGYGSACGTPTGAGSFSRINILGNSVATAAVNITNSFLGGTDAGNHAGNIQNIVALGDTACGTAVTSLVNTVCVGNEAGNGPTGTQSGNTVVGQLAKLGASATTSNTSAVGYQALRYNGGDDNAALGATAGLGDGTAGTVRRSVFLGSGAGSASISGDNQIIAGYNQQAETTTQSNVMNLGGTLLAKLDTKHFTNSTGSAPALSSCGGGSPAIVGTDTDGEITLGTNATNCTATFASSYTTAPLCVVTWQSNIASMIYGLAATALTITQTNTSSNKINYHCVGRNGAT